MQISERVKLTCKLLVELAVQNYGKQPELFNPTFASLAASVGCLVASSGMIVFRKLSKSKRSRAFFPVLSVLTLGSMGFQALAFYQCYLLTQRLNIDEAKLLRYKKMLEDEQTAAS